MHLTDEDTDLPSGGRQKPRILGVPSAFPARAAQRLGISRDTLRHWIEEARAWWVISPSAGVLTHPAPAPPNPRSSANHNHHRHLQCRADSAGARHTVCTLTGDVRQPSPGWVFRPTSDVPLILRCPAMSWTKPEAEVVAVTMEVTAYVATL